MRNVSTAFKRKVYNGNRNYLSFADITLNDDDQNPTVLHLENPQIVMGGFSIEDAISEDNSFTALGSVIIGSATLIINNITDKYSEYDFTNADVVMSISLPLSGNTIEPPIKLGTYRVDDATYDGDTITLSMLDYMEQFDRPYTTGTEFGTNGAKLVTVLEDVCESCGVVLDTLNFPHKDFRVKAPNTKDGITCREVVSWVAQIAGCYARCNANGHLELKWFNTSALATSDLDGGIFDPKVPHTDGADVDGGTFLPWNVGDVLDGGSFTDYSQSDTDGGSLQKMGAYPSGNTANGGTFSPWSEGQDYDGGEFTESRAYHYLYSLSSQNICVDDTVITGVRIVVENEEKPDDEDIGPSEPRYVDGNKFVTDVQENYTTHMLGTEGYVISIEDNGFITNANAVGDNDDGIIFWLGTLLIGLTFRKMTINMLDDPSIEAGDVARVLGRGTDEYDILITRSTFTVGGYQTVVCGSDTPLRNSATRFSEATKAYLKSKKELRVEHDKRTLLEEEIRQGLVAPGLFPTEEVDQSTGATTYYLHNKPNLEDSKIVWKMTSEAFGVTTDYKGAQTVWNAGLTASGDAIAHRLAVEGLTAEWVTVARLQSPWIDPSDTSLGRNFVLDETGALTMKKGSINIGNGIFVVDTQGNLTATSASLQGTVTSINNYEKMVLDESRLMGYHKTGNSWGIKGYLDLTALYGTGASGDPQHWEAVIGGNHDLYLEIGPAGTFEFRQTSGGYGTPGTKCGTIDGNGWHGDVDANIVGCSNSQGILQVRGRSEIQFETGSSNTIKGYVDNNGIHGDALHASNGYTGRVSIPTSIASDGTANAWVTVSVVDGIIVN